MPTLPCALTIAGLDPSGGAGVAADLRAFAAAGVWGCAAVAVLTVQSTAGLVSARAVPRRQLFAQVAEVLAHQRVRAIKTGALGSLDNVRGAAALLARTDLPAVVDPVLGATRARPRARSALLDPRALDALRALLRRATVVTPNAPEASILLDRPVTNVAQAAEAAASLVRLGARAALVKGGHLSGGRATDVLAIGERVVLLSSRRRRGLPLHGTGCTLASLIAGRIAASRELDDAQLLRAVRWAKGRIARGIAAAASIGDGLQVVPV